ncbi:hypothetical protein [uncultured Mediterranean phage uvDeep-CGR2-KM19-C269]|nr:hypothetical protein [uncultured Mediterranean phage uvDeep-CGR2-KM19-C269]
MNYKKGFKIKPERIDNKGRVYFTDGTNEVNPNQVSCEAYGYKYNKFSNTCSIDNASFNLEKEFQVSSNTLNGIDNKLNARVTNANINGNGNTAKGQNDSIFISGNNNTVSNGVNNAAILSGSNAEAIRTGEVIIGGSKDSGLPTTTTGLAQFRTQTTTFHLTGDTKINDGINYLTLSGKEGIFGIPMHTNSIGFLKGTIIGASEGSGQRYLNEFRCSVTKNASNVTNMSDFTLDTPLVDTIGNVGIGVSDGTQANIDTSTTDYDTGEVYAAVVQDLLSGSGATKNVTWSISINLVEQIHDLNTNITTNN